MLSKRQEADSKKCEEMQEKDQDMDCLSCSCNVCIAQEDIFSINNLVEKAHENSVKHGFWDDIEVINHSNIDALSMGFKQLINNAICTRLMLITGEVAETMEALRKGDTENFKEELADIIIRVADLAGNLDIDLEAEIKKKMQKNLARPYKHGKAF